MSHTVEVRVPFENVNDSSAKLVGWEVTSGQVVAAGQLLCRLETTKAVYDVCAPEAGVVRFTLTEGTEVPVGDVVARIESAAAGAAQGEVSRSVEGEQAAPKAEPSLPGRVASAEPATGAGPLFSRKAEVLRAQLGLNRDLFAGFGMVGEAEVRAVPMPNG